MKAYLALISAAVIGLSACSQEASKPAEPAAQTAPAASEAAPAPAESAPPADTPASEASAANTAAAPAAGNCAVTVESNDNMQFNSKDIQISKACKEFTITLKHTGTQPKSGMGHNIVISKAEDMDGVLKDGAAAGAEADFVKAGDARVVGHTKLIGGGEETSVTVDPAKMADGSYKFYCSFPGHGALMKGDVTLVN